jgi:hypothetical protein
MGILDESARHCSPKSNHQTQRSFNFHRQITGLNGELAELCLKCDILIKLLVARYGKMLINEWQFLLLDCKKRLQIEYEIMKTQKKEDKFNVRWGELFNYLN